MSGGVWITRTCLEAVQLLDRGKVKKRESVDGQKRKKKKNIWLLQASPLQKWSKNNIIQQMKL